MDLLIDTWNVLHQTGVLPPDSAGIGLRGLSQMIRNSRWSRARVLLVCDGTPSSDTLDSALCQTIFTGPYRTADDEIMARVANSSAPKSILVITSDREIMKSIRTRGAQHLGSADFLQSLVDDGRTPKQQRTIRPSGISSTIAEEWKEHFGIDDKTLEELQKESLKEFQESENTKSKKQKPKDVKSNPKTMKPQKIRQVKINEQALPPDLLEEARRLLGEDPN